MIQSLSIKNLAVIENVTLDLSSPFLALVGETGSGKSLTVDALSLLSGQKFDKSLLRDGAEKAELSALFVKGEEESEKGLYDENGELSLRRVFDREGTSRQWINGQAVSLREYREKVKGLVEIHRQGQNAELLDDSRSLEYVDRYGGKSIIIYFEKYKECYSDYLKCAEEKKAIEEMKKEMDVDYLDFQISEIERYDLKEGEIEELEEELSKLKDIEKIESCLEKYHAFAQLEEGELPDLIQSAVESLRPLSDTSLSDLFTEVREEGDKFLRELSELEYRFSEMREKTEEIDRMNARLFELKALQRKYGKSTKEILSTLEKFKQEKAMVVDYQETYRKAVEKEKKALDLVLERGNELSKEREKALSALKKAVNGEMKDLGLPGDGFDIRLTKKDPSADGLDECHFYAQLNKGLSSHELSKVVSGGEGARLMLAIKAVLNRISPSSLLVLDEIDTGVSGRMAGLMAQKIREISKDSQVIVISHLPQVVSMAKSHIGVRKKIVDGKTCAFFHNLGKEEVIEEIAKMISGKTKTESALLQARELYQEGQG